MPNSKRAEANHKRTAFLCPTSIIYVSIFSSSSRTSLFFTYFTSISVAPWLHLCFLYWRHSAWASEFILQSMPLTFLLLFLFDLFNCGNGNDLFWKPWLYSCDLLCKLLNVFHTDGVKRFQNYITTNSALAPTFSHRDLDSIAISPLLVSFMCLPHKDFTSVPRAQGEMEKGSRREAGCSSCHDRGVHCVFFEENLFSNLYKLSISIPLELAFQGRVLGILFLSSKKINNLLWLTAFTRFSQSPFLPLPFTPRMLPPCWTTCYSPLCLLAFALAFSSAWCAFSNISLPSEIPQPKWADVHSSEN